MTSGAHAIQTNLSRDKQLRGRQVVRNALQGFADDIAVFHNPKINLKEMNDLYDRPLDVVLWHRSRGLLGIVIKSGEIVEESNDLVSQYQPAKQYYKIIDPIKQVKKAMLALLEDFNPVLIDSVPITVVVFFPDTHRTEFSHANPLFMFKEDLASANLHTHLTHLFHESWDIERSKTYAANAKRLKEFLQSRCDSNIRRVERKEVLTKLGVREEKQAYQLPQKPVAKAVKPPVAKRMPDPRSGVKKTIPEAKASAVRNTFKAIDNHIKEHEHVEISGRQWGMLIAAAAIFICVAYFIGRNASIIMHGQ